MIRTGMLRFPTVLQSDRGCYFLGRTGLFSVPSGHEALVLLGNPPESSRRAFLVSVTATSENGRRAFFFFDPATPLPLQTSGKVTNAHRGSPETPQVAVQLATAPTVPISDGYDLFERLLEGGQTLVTEQYGRFVLEPGHSLGVKFPAIAARDDLDIAAGWWEEPVTR